jgi:hypothetical protein
MIHRESVAAEIVSRRGCHNQVRLCGQQAGGKSQRHVWADCLRGGVHRSDGSRGGVGLFDRAHQDSVASQHYGAQAW